MTNVLKLGALCATLALAATAAQATVLNFDGKICAAGDGTCVNSSYVSQSYGDTAAVDVQYNAWIQNTDYVTGEDTAALRFWTTNYNDLINVAWGGNGDDVGTAMVFLKPLTGSPVTLLGFDLGAYIHAERATQFTLVDGLGNELFSSGAILVGTGDAHNHFSFNITSVTGIGIQWGPSAYNVGIDNIEFSAMAGPGGGVPEPATWAMMLVGFGGLGAVVRRRRKLAVA